MRLRFGVSAPQFIPHIFTLFPCLSDPGQSPALPSLGLLVCDGQRKPRSGFVKAGVSPFLGRALGLERRVGISPEVGGERGGEQTPAWREGPEFLQSQTIALKEQFAQEPGRGASFFPPGKWVCLSPRLPEWF